VLQRARERLRQGLDLRRASNLHQRPPLAPDNQPDIVATRSSGHANALAGMPILRAKSGRLNSALLCIRDSRENGLLLGISPGVAAVLSGLSLTELV
jgi:hypothetical protein